MKPFIRMLNFVFIVSFCLAGPSMAETAPDSLFGRVSNNDATKSPLSVPFVAEDTNNHGKKFWLGPTRALSDTMLQHRYAAITGRSNRIFASFYYRGPGDNLIYLRRSLDFGKHFDSQVLISNTYDGAGPAAAILAFEKLAMVFYVDCSLPPSPFWALWGRNACPPEVEFNESSVLFETQWSSPIAYDPSLKSMGDELYCSFIYSSPNVMKLARSTDSGLTWQILPGDAGSVAGQFVSFVINDTVMTLIYRTPTWLETGIVQSYDRGATWTSQQFISTDSFIPSQLPAGCGNGISSLHATWYDFEGAPPGWAGWTFYRRSINNGQTWEPVQCMSTVAATEQVEIAADGNHTYCVWVDGRYISPNLALYMRHSWDDGATWSPEMKIVSEIDPAWDPDVYADGDVFYVVWREQHPPDWIWRICFRKGGWYLPGDVDHSDGLDIADLTYLINYMFKDGLPPKLDAAAQMDGLGGTDIADLTYLVNYMFKSGPPPVGEA